MRKGFTLIEILAYVALVGLMLGGISAFLLFSLKVQAKTRAEKEVMSQANLALQILTREIRGAASLYTPTSVFDANPGQLSLATNLNPPAGEASTYVDFFQCQTQLCLKREGQSPAAITSSSVQVQNLVFHLINAAGNVPSVQIQLTLSANSSLQRSDYRASVSLTSTASLR